MAVSERVHGWLNEATPMNDFDELRFRKIGVPSGSTVFGGKKETETDIDILMTMKQLEAILGGEENMYKQGGMLCYGKDHYKDPSFKSFYAKNKGGLIFNILAFYKEEDADMWKYATNSLVTMVALDEEYAKKLEDKEFRVNSFRHFKEQYREENR